MSKTQIFSKSADQYFSNYAEIESSKLSAFEILVQYIVIIPVFDEDQSSIEHLLTTPYEGGDVLFVLVFNTPNIQSKEKFTASKHLVDLENSINNTQRLFELTKQKYPLIVSHDNLSLHKVNTKHSLLCVDRTAHSAPQSSPATNSSLPYKQGVGLARKIGNDIASKLIQEGKVLHPWLFNTDADAKLPSNYFSAADTSTVPPPSAIIFPFKHEADLNALIYESSLNQYVKGLKYAQSPFAYHTIGSTLIISAESYIQARGFPKRNAGEDFHLLNKLRKLGITKSLEHTQTSSVIILSSRESHRVPFGTGPAIKNLQASGSPKKEAIFYSPYCFLLLKVTLNLFEQHFEINRQETTPHKDKPLEFILKQHWNSNPYLLPENWENEQEIWINSILTNTRILKLLNDSKACKNNRQWQQQVLQRFDALETLKYIRFLQTFHYPAIAYDDIERSNAIFGSAPDLVKY